MSQTVLVIDSNSAVQAITTLALNQTDCTVETLADGAQAYQRIRTLKPSVVLCAKELTGVDPFDLCKRIKAESRQTAFILLAPSEAAQVTSTMAQDAQYDEVIYKPFKSNRLREVVTALIQRNTASAAQLPMFFVAVQDALRKKILQRFLAKHGCQVLAEIQPELSASTLVLLDSGAKPPKGAAASLVFTLAPGAKGDKPNHVPTPLTGEGLAKAFRDYLTVQHAAPPPHHLQTASTASADEKSDIAAEIASHIFRRLLSAPAGTEKSLKQTAQIINDELQQLASKLGWHR